MKHYLFFLFFLVGIYNVSLAQKSEIIKDLNTSKAGQGNITIYQDESIEGLIGSKPLAVISKSVIDTDSSSEKELDISREPSGYLQTKGYKVQVFSGNDQRRSKNEAHSKKQLIENSFPDMEVVVTYNSPVWRVRAGNFKTYEEAFQALKELRNAFPSFGKEMQIVESRIKLPVY